MERQIKYRTALGPIRKAAPLVLLPRPPVAIGLLFLIMPMLPLSVASTHQLCLHRRLLLGEASRTTSRRSISPQYRNGLPTLRRSNFDRALSRPRSGEAHRLPSYPARPLKTAVVIAVALAKLPPPLPMPKAPLGLQIMWTRSPIGRNTVRASLRDHLWNHHLHHRLRRHHDLLHRDEKCQSRSALKRSRRGGESSRSLRHRPIM